MHDLEQTNVIQDNESKSALLGRERKRKEMGVVPKSSCYSPYIFMAIIFSYENILPFLLVLGKYSGFF